MAAAKPRKRLPMSAEHKHALAKGRDEGRAVRRYLEAIEQQRPRRGRKRTAETVRRRLATVKTKLADADPLARLHLLQEQADLTEELDRMQAVEDLAALEKAFVKVAKGYSGRKGIGYNAWRAAGVPAAVLAKAGISRAD